MKTRAIIQARMLSSRLRGKSLISVAGVPLLYRVIQSVRQFPFIDEIMIATTRSEADDPIAAAANNLGVDIYRGDSMNVLKRFKDASSDMDEEDLIIRFTADNPFYHIEIAEKVYNSHLSNNFDYSHIDGLSHIVPEFIKVRALREINALVREDFDKEHVTPYLRKHKDQFKVQTLPGSYEGLRDDLDRFLTIDTREDLDRFEELILALKLNGKVPDFGKIFQYLEQQQHQVTAAGGLQTKLGSTRVGDGHPCYIIAEIGQNHNGSMDNARKLIDMAVRCGANAVKFQKRDIASELTKEAYDRVYDSHNSFGHTYGEHREFLELDEEQHKELKEYSLAQGITYFCTPCDIPSVEMMERLGVPFYKVASRDLTNLPTLDAIAKTGKPVILSTGMASLEDIEQALEVLGNRPESILILQCTSQYPAELEKVNLRAMSTLREKFKKITGFSDHTAGIIASVTASILGAAVIEKHITLSRAMKGSDQAGSLEETGLKLMVKYIREAEKSLGDGIKAVDPVTRPAKEKLARSITSKVPIPAGTILEEAMLCLKSPGTGLKWAEKELLIGKKSRQAIPSDVTLTPEMFE